MSFVFNVAKGKLGYYGVLPAANDGLVWVPIMFAGIETDAVLKDYQTLAALLAASNDEQTTMGRKVVTTGATATVDYANDWLDVTAADVVWASAGGPRIAALLLCYDPDTTTGDDTTIIPLIKFDYDTTPNGGNIAASIPSPGYFRAI